MDSASTAPHTKWQQTQSSSADRAISPDNRLNPDTDVMLRVECMSARSLKGLVFQGGVLRYLVFAVLVVFVVLEATHHVAEGHKRSVFIASTIIGGLCTALLATQGILLLRTLWQVHKLQKHWSDRRKRLVTCSALSIAFMLVASLLWMTQNAYAASRENCRMYSTYCRWAEAIVWTMLNCWLFLQLVLAHAATAWTDATGKPLQRLLLQRRSWLEDVSHRPALVFDAPWPANLTKLIPWAVMQTSLVLQLVGQPQGQAEACAADVSFASHTPCYDSSTYKSHRIVAYTGLGVYLCFHMWYIRMGRKYHSLVPYTSFRIGLVLMRSQEGNMVGVSAFGITCAAWLLTIIFRPSACIACLQAPTHIVLMLSIMRLLVAQFAFFTPMPSSKDDPVIVQEWMQFFAWTEHSKPAKRAERQSHVPERQQKLLAEHPIFCFETAIKLLYWCGFVYEHDEGRKVLKLSQETALGLFHLEHLRLVRSRTANVKCLVAWSNATLLVAFRGTANLTNMLADVKAWMVSQAPVTHHRFLQSAPKVHSGFHAAWSLSSLKDAVTQLIKDNITPEAAAKMHVLLTGHSLGGVMANLAAVDIANIMEWGSVKVYTVGAPRAGNHAYAKMYNKLIPDTWGIINYRDPVPKMAKFWFLYARPGNRVLLYKNGDIIVCPTPLDMRLQGFRRCAHMSSHKLTSYRASLVEVLKAQIKSERVEPGLEGVIELAESVALKEVLLDADADMDAATALQPSVKAQKHDTEGFANSEPPAAEKQPNLEASNQITHGVTNPYQIAYKEQSTGCK